MAQQQKLTTFLWFKGQLAEEAAGFYVSVLPDARVVSSSPMATTFEVAGTRLVALNGNPGQGFTEAMSILIECEDQNEVDHLWSALTAGGGQPGRCGWLTDRYGVSWQVIPRRLTALMGNPAVVQAMMKMSKIDVAELERANRA
ncbi:MAG TPA: VOC family protein [Polyangia bacterium]|nr:VOC family protein [Polyangia bacterium]